MYVRGKLDMEARRWGYMYNMFCLGCISGVLGGLCGIMPDKQKVRVDKYSLFEEE